MKNIISELIDLGIVKPDEGCGDAMLIVEYLAYGIGKQRSIFEKEESLTIVTDDRKLYMYCNDNNIDSIKSREFFRLCGTIR